MHDLGIEVVHKMILPAHVLEDSYVQANFIIPVNKSIRGELLRTLEGYYQSEKIFIPGNKHVRVVLHARIAAINAYDFAMEHNSEADAT